MMGNGLVERLVQVLAALIAILLVVLLADDAQIMSFLGLDANDLQNPGALLDRVRILAKSSLILLFLFLLSAVVLFSLLWRSKSNSSSDDIISIDAGVDEIVKRLYGSDVEKIHIWGYSFNWQSKISQSLRENPKRGLEAFLYVPALQELDGIIGDANYEERKAILRLRLGEWRSLADSMLIRRLTVVELKQVPSDLGVLLGGDYAIIHSYDWHDSGSVVEHSRQPPSSRKFLRITADSASGRKLLKYISTQLLCRRHDYFQAR
ncbi:hypothetical protein [Streptosporangium saharense]|uniref:hypothetical protein n=1 Tax=Streptosporangium saharense TaxID=1706840 RepID=UPI00342A9373